MIEDYLKTAADTREKFHMVALYAYMVKGAHNTTFQSLADQLGISQAALYKYYRSKDELMVAAIGYAGEKGRQYLSQGENHNDTALNRFKYHIKRNIDFCIEDRLHSIGIITMSYFANCVPEVKKLHEDINLIRIERIKNYLNQARHEKSINIVNVNEVAETIHTLLLGEMIKTYLWPEEKNSELRTKQLWKTITKLVE